MGAPPRLVTAAAADSTSLATVDDTVEFPGDDRDDPDELDGEEEDAQDERLFLPVVTR